MGVQKPTRHTRQLKTIPARRERSHEDASQLLNRRAEIARSTRTPSTTRDSSAVGATRFSKTQSGYSGYEVGGTGPAGAVRKPLGRSRRPGMPTLRVKKETFIKKAK